MFLSPVWPLHIGHISQSLNLIGDVMLVYKKAWELYLKSVPLFEALELPNSVERTTQKPHAEYVYNRTTARARALPDKDFTYPQLQFIVASFLTEFSEIFQVSKSQEGASSNAFQNVVAEESAKMLKHIAASLQRKFTTTFATFQIFCFFSYLFGFLY